MMEQVVRLYLGYLGNLGERVPELAGFWLLTILLQLPMQVIAPHNHNPHESHGMSHNNPFNQFCLLIILLHNHLENLKFSGYRTPGYGLGEHQYCR